MRFYTKFSRWVGGAPGTTALGSDARPTGAPDATTQDNLMVSFDIENEGSPLQRVAVACEFPALATALNATLYLWEEETGLWFATGAPIDIISGAIEFLEVVSIIDTNERVHTRAAKGGGLHCCLVVTVPGAAVTPAGEYIFAIAPDMANDRRIEGNVTAIVQDLIVEAATHLEDAIHNGGDRGFYGLVVRDDTLVLGPFGVNGDYIGLKANIKGSLWTVIDPLTMPLAAALSDAIANPTTTTLGAATLAWDATAGTWRRAKVRQQAAIESLAVVIASDQIPLASALSDAFANPTTATLGSAMMAWDATAGTWRRVEVRQQAAVESLSVVIASDQIPLASALSDAFANPTTATLGAAMVAWDATAGTWRRAKVRAQTSNESLAVVLATDQVMNVPEGSENAWVPIAGVAGAGWAGVGSDAEPPVTAISLTVPGAHVQLNYAFSPFTGAVAATEAKIQVWIKVGATYKKHWSRIYKTAELEMSETSRGILPVTINFSSDEIAVTVTMLDGTTPLMTGNIYARRIAVGSGGAQASDFLFNTDTGHQLVETRGYDESADAQRVFDVAPLNIAGAPEDVANHLNVAAATYPYYVDMRAKRTGTIQLKLDTVSVVTILASNNPTSDATTITDWSDITASFGDTELSNINKFITLFPLRPTWLKFNVVVSNPANTALIRFQESN